MMDRAVTEGSVDRAFLMRVMAAIGPVMMHAGMHVAADESAGLPAEHRFSGRVDEGRPAFVRDPKRIDFDPFPWDGFAVWILTQMKRWGQVKGDVDYAGLAKQVFLETDTAKLMKEAGLTPPTPGSKTIVVMGKSFDASKPEDYVKSFAIKRG